MKIFTQKTLVKKLLLLVAIIATGSLAHVTYAAPTVVVTEEIPAGDHTNHLSPTQYTGPQGPFSNSTIGYAIDGGVGPKDVSNTVFFRVIVRDTVTLDYNFSIKISTRSSLSGASELALVQGSINPATTTKKIFAVTMNGLTPSTKYYYKVFDKKYGTSMSNTLDFTTTAPIVVASGGTSVTLESKGQAEGSATGLYFERFNITPDTASTSARTVDLKVFDLTNTQIQVIPVTLLPGSNITSPGTDDLNPGSYTAAIYSGTTKLSATIPFTITQSVQTPQSATPQTGTPIVSALPPVVTSGVFIGFPTDSQKLTETTATIKGVVSTELAIPVNISFLYAQAGQPLANSQQLLNVSKLEPGTNAPITFNFTGLVPGTKYQFAIKNNISNKISSPLVFTTPGGDTNETAVFEGVRIGQNGDPGGGGLIEDTISEKGIVPRCSLTAAPGVTDEEQKMCGYQDFLKLISNIIQYLLIILGPIVAILAMFAGAMIIWYGKMPDLAGDAGKQIKKYKDILVRVIIGLLIILSAFVLVSTIIRELGVKPDYTLLDIIGLN